MAAVNVDPESATRIESRGVAVYDSVIDEVRSKLLRRRDELAKQVAGMEKLKAELAAIDRMLAAEKELPPAMPRPEPRFDHRG